MVSLCCIVGRPTETYLNYGFPNVHKSLKNEGKRNNIELDGSVVDIGYGNMVDSCIGIYIWICIR